MDPHRPELDHTRLFECAEACVRVTLAYQAKMGTKSPHPGDYYKAAVLPPDLAPFERWEVEEACAFLTRMGVFYQAGPGPGAQGGD